MSREKILARVREALSVPTDPHVRRVVQSSSDALPVLAQGAEGRASAVKQFLPHVGESHADRVAAFAALSTKLQTEFICVDTQDQAQQALNRLSTSLGWKRVGIHDHPLLQTCSANMNVDFLNTSHRYDVRELEQCDVGVSVCEALIAQTASVLVTSHSSGGRALSVLPPHHVVLATTDQLVTTMADGYAVLRHKYSGTWPSFISFITGPSRTADIERVLVLGAHGPKKLTVILIGANPSL